MGNLPVGVQRIEYLEASEEGGFVDINTGYIPTAGGNVIYLKINHFGFKSGSNRASYFHNGMEEGARYRLNQSNTGVNMYIYNASDFHTLNVGAKTEFILELHPSERFYIVNGIQSGSSSSNEKVQCNVPIHLFGRWNEENNYLNPNGRIFYFKWEKDGEPVLDLIPVRVGDVGYMYDTVSGKLFGNSGSGHFILGPDIN